jgi:preprotein translocase subunit SecA
MRSIERRLLLAIIDRHWVEYLTGMEDLRQEIGLQAIAQRDPLIEYQRNAFGMFEELKTNIEREVVYQIIHVSFQYEQHLRQLEAEQLKRLVAAQQAQVAEDDSKSSARTVRNDVRMPGRNDPCPCGSGKKFKVCHLGREQELLAQLQAQGAATSTSKAADTAAPVARGKRR